MVHVPPAERRLQREHLVDDAAQRPYVRLVTVGLVLPDLGARVVRGARLRVVQAVLVGGLAHVHVAQFGLVEVAAVSLPLAALLVAKEKDVRRLDVPVHDAQFVHGPQPVDRLDEDAPHLALSEVHLALLAIRNHPQEVSTVR